MQAAPAANCKSVSHFLHDLTHIEHVPSAMSSVLLPESRRDETIR